MKTQSIAFNPRRRQSLPSRSFSQRALTLTEVMIAMVVLGLTTLGILGTLIQSRRMTEISLRQNYVNTFVQGIVEQMRSRSLPPATGGTGLNLLTSIPTASTNPDVILEDYVLPAGLSDLTLSRLPVLDTSTGTSGTKVANTFTLQFSPSVAISLTMWLWVENYQSTTPRVGPCRAITAVYTWTASDGRRNMTFTNQICSIKSDL